MYSVISPFVLNYDKSFACYMLFFSYRLTGICVRQYMFVILVAELEDNDSNLSSARELTWHWHILWHLGSGGGYNGSSNDDVSKWKQHDFAWFLLTLTKNRDQCGAKRKLKKWTIQAHDVVLYSIQEFNRLSNAFQDVTSTKLPCAWTAIHIRLTGCKYCPDVTLYPHCCQVE